MDAHLFEMCLDCAKVLDVDGRLRAMNRNGRCLMEIEDFDSVAGHEWASLWPSESREAVAKAVREAASGATSRFQAFCPTAKGAPRWWDVSVSPVIGSDGTVESILSLSRDVTEFHTSRQALRQLTAQLQLALRSGGIGPWDYDPASGELNASPDFERCLGHEAPAGPWTLDRLLEHIHPDDQARVQEQHDRLRQGCDELTYECRVLWPDGDEHYARFSAACLLADDGSPVRVVGTVQDVSSERWAAEELREMTAAAIAGNREAELERQRLDALLEAAPVGIGYADATGAIVRANSANRELWGQHPDSRSVDEYGEWKGWWADGSARHGEPIQAHEWGLARALHGETVEGDLIEIEPFGLPGTRRSVLLRARPVRDVDGAVSGAVVAQVDVTERMRAHALVRDSEAKFRTIANAMPQMVWSTLPDGYHDFYNDQWYRFTGVPEGSTDGEGWNGMFHPDDQEHAWASWRHSLATGEPYEIEYRLRDHSGQYRWVLGRALPIRDESGRITRWMGTCTDIHEQSLAREALTESEARFRALAENIPQLAWMTAADGGIFWYNDRWFEYTGTTLEQVRGNGWQAVHHPDHVDRVVEKFQSHIEQGIPWEDTFPLRSRDGEYRWFLSRAVPIRDEEGRITRWFGTNTDVTDQRKAEAALREADRRKDEFLAMLAHELRNPLAPISAAAELLRLPSASGEHAERTATIIARQVRHMTKLVDDLLDVSRVTRGLVTLELQTLDLREAARAAIEQVRPLIEARRHALAIGISAERLFVNGDRTRLTQIIANLLNNAAKYTDTGGTITLDLHAAGDQARLIVKDNGRGITAELLPHVFELFVQGENSSDRNQGGLGIGLALVKQLVALHGGTAAAASGGVGQGSVFEVRLPLQMEIDTSVTNSRSITGPSARLRIDVVDDNEDAAETLALLLTAYGHAVRTFASAKPALDAARKSPADVYVLDIGLPGMDGYALARALRSTDGVAGATLFALSGYGQNSDVEAALEAGFDAHFTKPIAHEKLVAALSLVQGSSPAIRNAGQDT